MNAEPRVLSSGSLTGIDPDILSRMGVDPGGIQRMVTKLHYRLIYLQQIPSRCANILKQEMLALGGDAAVARGTVACSIETTPVLLMGTEKQILKLCERLPAQPFGLKKVAEEIETVVDRYVQVPSVWQGVRSNIDLSQPRIMAVLNVTPDSFSDGGSYLRPEDAIEQAKRLADDGADIIDIGGESTRPGSKPVSVEEELQRVVPVIEQIAVNIGVSCSIDTTKAAVAKAAIDAGAEFINDVSGLTFDIDMAAVAAKSGAGLAVMHTRGRPDVMQSDTEYVDLVSEVYAALFRSVTIAESAGIARDRIAVDPGIGFGKSVEGNIELLRRLDEFRSLGLPILLGTSRKSFIGKILAQDDPQNRLAGTLSTVALGVAAGASIFRVHDVREAREAAMVAHAVTKGIS